MTPKQLLYLLMFWRPDIRIREIVNNCKIFKLDNINIEMFHKCYLEQYHLKDFKNGFRPPKTTKYYTMDIHNFIEVT